MQYSRPRYWMNCVSTVDSNQPSATTPFGAGAGVTVTLGTLNVMGALSTLIANLGFTGEYEKLFLTQTNINGQDIQGVFEIMMAPASTTTYTTFAGPLMNGQGNTPAATSAIANEWEFPLLAPAGYDYLIRGQTNSGTLVTGSANLQIKGTPSDDVHNFGTQTEAIGVNLANSGGTSFTVGTIAQSLGACTWANIGAVTHRTTALQVMLTTRSAGITARGYFVEVGYGSSKLVGSPVLSRQTGANETGWTTFNGLIECDIPAGTTIQLRANSSTTTAGAQIDGAILAVQ